MASNLGVKFGRALLMVRGTTGLTHSVNFYQNALGMTVLRHTDDWAELTCGIASTSAAVTDGQQQGHGHGYHRDTDTHGNNNSTQFRLSLKAVENEAQLSCGYTPFLSFHVADMDTTIASCVQFGGHLDGPIQYPAHGKVAALRTPDGHMIGLYEPAM